MTAGLHYFTSTDQKLFTPQDDLYRYSNHTVPDTPQLHTFIYCLLSCMFIALGFIVVHLYCIHVYDVSDVCQTNQQSCTIFYI